MLARVSNIEAWRRFMADDEAEVADLVARLTGEVEPSPAMLAGTAFHKAMEDAVPGEFDTLSALGHTFRFVGGEVELPSIRETRTSRAFGPLTVTGQADAVEGRIVTDHKTTKRFDAEGYLGGCQWRFYLSLFGADLFRWNVFEIREVEPLTFEVGEPQVLTAARYPGMEADCLRLAEGFHAFALTHLPAGWSA
jgi:hypothetical protein